MSVRKSIGTVAASVQGVWKPTHGKLGHLALAIRLQSQQARSSASTWRFANGCAQALCHIQKGLPCHVAQRRAQSRSRLERRIHLSPWRRERPSRTSEREVWRPCSRPLRVARIARGWEDPPALQHEVDLRRVEQVQRTGREPNPSRRVASM